MGGNGNSDGLQVVFACVEDVDIVAWNVVFASARRRLRRVDGLGLGKCFGLKRLVFVNDGTGVVGQCPACVRGRVADQVFGSARAYDPSARIAAFRAQIDNPVGRADDVQIVFDDQQGMARRKQLANRAHEFCHVVEMQAGGGFVEQEQTAFLCDWKNGGKGKRGGVQVNIR